MDFKWENLYILCIFICMISSPRFAILVAGFPSRSSAHQADWQALKVLRYCGPLCNLKPPPPLEKYQFTLCQIAGGKVTIPSLHMMGETDKVEEDISPFCSNDICLSFTIRLSRRKWARSCCRTLRGILDNIFYLSNYWKYRWPPQSSHLLPAPMLWLMKEVTMCLQLGTQRLWCSPSSKKCRCAKSLEYLVMKIFNSRHQ